MKKRGQYGASSGMHAESAIPIILIIILAIFIAGKFGIVDFSSVPVLNSIFPAPSISVAVIGTPSAAMQELLRTDDYRSAGIVYVGNLDQRSIYSGSLKSFDVIILQANDGNTACDRSARKVIADRIKAGGKLIVIQDACTTMTDDRTVLGWEVGIDSLGSVMPVIVGGVSHDREEITTAAISGKLKIVAFDHRIMNVGQKNFAFTDSRVTRVTPKGNSNVLAIIDESYSGKVTSPSTYAIVESSGMFGGKTMYFAYDPAKSAADGNGRQMFLSTLLYLKGSKG